MTLRRGHFSQPSTSSPNEAEQGSLLPIGPQFFGPAHSGNAEVVHTSRLLGPERMLASTSHRKLLKKFSSAVD